MPRAMFVAFMLTVISNHALAQATEVPSLESALSNLSSEDRGAFDQSLSATGVLSADLGAALEQAAVNQAVAQGLVSEADAQNVEKVLAIIESNADSFNFDIKAEIDSLITSGDVSLADVTATLAAFDQLSDEAKAIVGNQDFDPSNLDQYNLSDSDKDIILSVDN